MTTREPGPEQRSRPDRPGPERPSGAPLDLLLEGRPLPDGDPGRWQPAALVLAALTSAPESSELAGEARALAEFRARGAGTQPPSRVRRRSPGWVASLRGTRPAVAVATGAVLMGGLLAVAYAGDLPDAAQRLAHDTIDAPPAGGPAATGREPGVPPGPASPLPAGAGASGPGAATSARHVAHSSPAGSRRHRRPSSSAPGTGRGSSGAPGPVRQPRAVRPPGPVWQPQRFAHARPDPAALTLGEQPAPPAGATPSPSAAPSATRRSAPRHGYPRAGAQSAPP